MLEGKIDPGEEVRNTEDGGGNVLGSLYVRSDTRVQRNLPWGIGIGELVRQGKSLV